MMKQYFGMMGIVAIAAGSWPAASAKAQCAAPFGDVNGDGTTNVSDVACTILGVLWNLAGQVGDAPPCLVPSFEVADVDCSGQLQVTDAQIIIQVALGQPLPLAIDADGNGCTDACEVSSCGNAIFEPEQGEECDDGNACDLDGCAPGCASESSLAIVELQIAAGNLGFDIDNADGDNNPKTGIDNKLGGNSLLVGQINPIITESVQNGNLGLAFTFGGVDNPTNDPTVDLALHQFIDPSCPNNPVYGPSNLPPWIGNPPAVVYSDSEEFVDCAPPAAIYEADNPSNGIYPVSTAGQPPAPVLSMAANALVLPAGGLGDVTLFRPRLEATVVPGGGRIVELANGLLGGAIPPSVLWSLQGTGSCPTALHAVLCFVGGMDIDVEGTGLDTIQYSGCGVVPCVFLSNPVIGSCKDGDTGVTIQDGPLDGSCVLDPRMKDGFSAAFQLKAKEVLIVEQRAYGEYCE